MAYIGNSPAELVTELDNSVVTAEKLANNAVTAAKIVDGTIIADDLSTGIIVNSKVAANAAIAASKLAISGGSNITLQSDGTFDLDASVDVTGGYSVGGTAVISSSRAGTLSSLALTGDITKASGNLTLDVAGSIILDANSGEIQLKDNTVEFGQLAKSSNDFRINHAIQDGSIVFRGNDNGSIISALTLDMSDAGRATFNAGILSKNTNDIRKNQITTQYDTSSFLRLHPENTTNNGGFTNMFFGTSTVANYGVAIGGVREGTDGTPSFAIRMHNDSIVGTKVLTIDSMGRTGIGKVPASSTGSMLQIEGNDGIAFRRPNQTNHFVLRPLSASGGDGMRFTQEGVGDRMVLDASGNVGIGTSDPHDAGVNFSMLTLNGAKGGGIVFSDNDVNQHQIYTTDDASLRFARGSDLSSESMRLDNSGGLHIGTEEAGSYPKTGHSIRGGDSAIFSRTGTTGESVQLRRDNSNGEWIRFYRGASTITGVLGDGGGALYIRGNTNGIMFNGASIEPVGSASIGTRVSNTVNLGSNSYRFNDIHLSGSIEIENGTGNVGVGKQALNSNSANENTAVGYRAGYTQTSGGNYNTYMGYASGYNNTGGDFNTYYGYQSGYYNQGGTGNTFIGKQAGYHMSGGNYNTIVGGYNGNQNSLNLTALSNNIVLADGAGMPAYWAEGNGSIYEHHWKVTFTGTATGYGSGAAANTWHKITAVDLNSGEFTYANNWIVLTFANASPAYGYTGTVQAMVANSGANVSYTGRVMMGCDPAGTFGYQLPLSVGTHTGTSSLVMEMKVEVDGNHKRLFVRSNVNQTTNSAVFGVPELKIISRKWIE